MVKNDDGDERKPSPKDREDARDEKRGLLKARERAARTEEA